MICIIFEWYVSESHHRLSITWLFDIFPRFDTLSCKDPYINSVYGLFPGGLMCNWLPLMGRCNAAPSSDRWWPWFRSPRGHFIDLIQREAGCSRDEDVPSAATNWVIDSWSVPLGAPYDAKHEPTWRKSAKKRKLLSKASENKFKILFIYILLMSPYKWRNIDI